MIVDFELIYEQDKYPHISYGYKFRFSEDGNFFKGTFINYPDEHTLVFIRYYKNDFKSLNELKISPLNQNEVEEIVKIVLNLPKFRLRHLINPYKLSM